MSQPKAPPGLYKGIAQFNRQEFFECHETLEEIWIAEPGEVRQLYQGILQIGVAFYHATHRKNYRGATRLLQTGMAYLRPFGPVYFGIDLAGLLDGAENALRQLEELGPARIAEFDEKFIPRISFTESK
jgi:predicted metal-dependent hydrolase